MMKKMFLLSILFSCLIFKIQAQQDAQYTQYMYNTFSINPAYAGSRGVFSVTGLHRSQWIGLDGAPKTQTLNIHSPYKKKIGLGLSIVNDEIGNGTSQETYIDGAVSYTIKLSRYNKLSFGIKASAHLLSLDFSKLSGYNNEVSGSSLMNIDKKLSPNFGAGLYYHNNSFYVGLSVPNFLNTQHFDNSSGASSSFLSKERMNFYLITGYVYDLNPNLKFKPAILFKGVSGAPLQTDISTNFLIRDKLVLGAAYRWGAAFSVLAGFEISEQIMIGVGYDREITELGDAAFNNGSFEFILRYELLNNPNKIFSPRFF